MAPKPLILVLAFAVAVVSAAEYRRPPPRGSLSRLLLGELNDIDSTTPQQVLSPHPNRCSLPLN